MTKIRRAKRESRNEDKQRERRNRIRALLVQFGFWDELKDGVVKNYLLQAYYPPIEISVSDQIPADDRIRTLVRELEWTAQNATFDCPILGANYSIVDYFMYVKPLTDRLRKIPHDIARSDLVQKLKRISNNAIETLYHENLCKVLFGYGRLDGYLYFLNWTVGPSPHKKMQQKIVTNRDQPEQRTVIKGTNPRPAYRCGLPVFGGVEWVDWLPSVIGLQNDEELFPVFVQSHVLKKLHERGSQVFYGDNLDGRLQYSLAVSLSDPQIHPNPRDDGAFLVAYYFGKYKIGYLVARKVDDLILVETFLFLTMDGTPEGTKLWKQLRLDRPGKEYTGLDNPWTFLMTDLALDPDLVAIFEKCGCGHLFQMGKDLRINDFETGYAADIRKFLRLKPPTNKSIDV